MSHPTLNAVTCAAILLLFGCGESQQPVRLFKQGDIVEFVVSGQRAQIIWVNQCTAEMLRRGYPCTYDVRAFSPQTHTNTHLLSSDGPLSTAHIARITYVAEYELRKAKE